MASESRRAMIAITTSSSINVNPERGRTASPIPIGLAVDTLSLREQEDVEDIVAFTGIVGRARVAALSPGGRGGKRGIGVQGIARDAAQEVDLRLLRALLVVDALGEVLEFLGIARVADRLLDQTLVRCLFVEVDRLADLAQRAAQLLLLGALHGELADGQRDRCEERDDRHGDHELYEGKTPRESRNATCGHGTRAASARYCGCTPPKGTIVPPGGVAPGSAAGAGDSAGPGWVGAKEDGEEAAPSGPPLDEASVPAADSTVRASGRTIVRISFGVMRSTISVLVMVSLVDENRRPSTGKRSEEHTSELQSHSDLVCRLLLEKKNRDGLREKVRLHDAQPARCAALS